MVSELGARHPKDHHVVVTAVLGTCRAEEMVGVRRLTNEGNVCQTTTPMARPVGDDSHQGRADERSSGDVAQPEAERGGDLYSRVLGRSKVSGVSLWKR